MQTESKNGDSELTCCINVIISKSKNTDGPGIHVYFSQSSSAVQKPGMVFSLRWGEGGGGGADGVKYQDFRQECWGIWMAVRY